MSFGIYKMLHLLGVALVVLALGGLSLHAMNGGAKADNRSRGLAAAMHGIGLLLILVAGFGMLGAHNLGFGGWVHGKLTIWLLMGGAVALAQRNATTARLTWFVVPLLVALAAHLGYEKPGAQPAAVPTATPTQP